MLPSHRARETSGTMRRPVRYGSTIAPDNYFYGSQYDGIPAGRWIGYAPNTYGVPTGPNGPFAGSGSVTAAVERATSILVGPLVSVLPWRVYAGQWRGEPQARDLGARLWFTDPTLTGNVRGVGRSVWSAQSRKGRTAFWSEWVRNAVLYGRSWLTFAEQAGDSDAYGEPLAGTLRILSPWALTQTDDGWVIGDPDDPDGSIPIDFDGRYEMGGRRWRVVALDEPLGDGTGVMGRHAAELGLAVQVREYLAGTFRSGVPAGYLQMKGSGPLTQTDADLLKSKWIAANGGDRRSVAVLGAGVEFSPIAWNPEQTQAVEVDNAVLRMIAHAFNLSSRALDSGAGSSMTYSTIEQERQDRLDDSISPWKNAVEDAITSVLPYGTWLELDVRGYLQTDPAKRTAYYAAGIAGGWIDPAEVRPYERLPRRPGEEPVDRISEPGHA